MGVAQDEVSTCFVYRDDKRFYYDVVPGKYVIYFLMNGVEEHAYGKYENGDKMYLGLNYSYERFEIRVYDLRTGEDRELFDMAKYMEEHPEWQATPTLGCCEADGTDVFQVKMKPRPKEGVSVTYAEDPIWLLIDIEDGSFEVRNEALQMGWKSDDILTNMYWTGESLLDLNLPEDLIQELGSFYAVETYHNYEGVYRMFTTAEYLPEHNEELYDMFPELEQYRGQENCYICMIIGNDPSEEELLRLRMEDEDEISFEGLVLAGEYSIDGEDHEIHSFEECEQWIR